MKHKLTVDHLPFGVLRVNDRVQRATIPARVKKLTATWVLGHVGAITVSIRDGVAWIIDGQHRWHAAMERGLGDTKVLCHVYRGLTEEEEARLFLALNDSRNVSGLDRYNVGLIAKDPICVGVYDILAGHGLKIGSGAGDVRCVSEVLAIYGRSPELLEDVLKTITTAWGTRVAALERIIFAGLGIVLHRYNGECDHAILTTKLAKYRGGPGALCGDAKGLTDYKPISISRACAEIVVDTYNKGRGSGRLSPL